MIKCQREKISNHRHIDFIPYVLVFVVLLGLFLPSKVCAAATIATVKFGGNSKNYDSVESINDAMDDNDSNAAIVIDMTDDWVGQDHLNIPDNSQITINMHGHMMNRNLSDYEKYGEVISVGKNVSLTIEGGTETTSHTTSTWTSTSTSAKRNGSFQGEGAMITGGYSSNDAGGIDIRKNSTVVIKNVSIVGNRAEQNWGTDGYGGGIRVYGTVKLTLNHVNLIGNYAYNDGGAIYADNSNDSVFDFDDTLIEKNYCDDEGGGICLDGEYLVLTGGGDSKIFDNHADGYGGGIYLWNDDVSVSGFEICNNTSTSDGGGIYVMETECGLSNLNIHNNKTSAAGGGIYVNNSKDSISGCTITDNTSAKKGGGVYAYKQIAVSGKTTIKDNHAESAISTNLYLCSYGDIGVTKGSDVHIGSNSEYQGKTMSEANGYYNPSYITYDKDSWNVGYAFSSQRGYLYLTQESKTVSTVKNVADTVNKTFGKYGENDEYDLYKGYFHHTTAASGDQDSVFYYSDGYFAGDVDPAKYNEHLATTSLNLAMSGMYLSDESDYNKKHAAIRKFLSNIGCEEDDIYVNTFNTEKPGTDTIGVAIGSKLLEKSNGDKTGEILIPIAIRGAGYEAEWASNLTIGTSGEEQGFSEAAEIAFKEVNQYIEDQNLTSYLEEGKVKFWVVGFSRAGAAANLLSKRLVDKYQNYAVEIDGNQITMKNQIFGYTFEAPQGGIASEEKESSDYTVIHNIVNALDIVPLVAPTKMGFKRYGVDHFVPGNQTIEKVENRDSSYGGVSDNTYYYMGDTNYSQDYQKMQKFVQAMSPDFFFVPSFQKMEMRFVASKISGDMISPISSNQEAEKWVREFIEHFLSNLVPDRGVWAEDKVQIGNTTYASYQQAARDVFALLYKDGHDGFLDKVSVLQMELSSGDYGISMSSLWWSYIGNWKDKTAAEKKEFFDIVWKLIQSSGMLDSFSNEEITTMKQDLPPLIDLAMRYVDCEYTKVSQSNVNLATAIFNMANLMMNHYPEMCMSWLRVYDGYYNGDYSDDYSSYVIDRSDVDAPKAYTLTDSNKNYLDADEENDLIGDQTIKLNVENVSGEVIVYTLKDTTNGVEKGETVYQKQLKLPLVDGKSTVYELTTYAVSLGVKSEPVTYRITLHSKNHVVKVTTQDDDDEKVFDKVQTFEETIGDTVTLSAYEPTNMRFQSWTITNDEGVDVTDLLLEDEEKEKAHTSFIMPDVDEESFSYEYSLNIKANYMDCYAEAYVDINTPVSGETLDDIAIFKDKFGNTILETDDMTWSYKDEKGNDIIDSGSAYNNSVYTATIRFTDEESQLFRKDFMAKLMEDVPDGTLISTGRYDSSGVINVKITFPATASSGGLDPGEDTESYTLTVTQVDKNNGETMDTIIYNVTKNKSVTLTVPEIEDERFSAWDLKDSGITLVNSSLTDSAIHFKMPDKNISVEIDYLPVVNEFAIEMDAPETDVKLADYADRVKIKVTNIYYADPKDFSITWSSVPSDGYAEPNTTYSMTLAKKNSVIHLVDENGNMIDRDGNITEERTEQATVSGNVAGAANAKVTVNGSNAFYDAENFEVYYTFDRTDAAKPSLVSIQSLSDIYDIAYGISMSKMMKLLKEEAVCAYLNLADGTVSSANIAWDSIRCKEEGENLCGSVYTATGTVSLPDGVTNPKNVSLNVCVDLYEDDAPSVELPKSSKASGVYKNSLNISLTSDTEGADIYYTLDGSDATIDSTLYTEEFTIPYGTEEVILNVIAVEEDMVSSSATYRYTFAKRYDVPKNATFDFVGNDIRVLTADPAYDFDISGCDGLYIDGKGNVVAEAAGTYEIKASLEEDGAEWIIKKAGEEDTYTTEDQTILITVNALDLQLKEVVDPEDITGVDFGLSMDDVKKLLPDDARVYVINGTEELDEKVSITWTDVKENTFDPTGATPAYTAIGTITLPSLVQNPDNISTEVSVDVYWDKNTIDTRPIVTKITSPKDITGLYSSTTAKQLQNKLPKTVKVTLSDGKTINATVTWNDVAFVKEDSASNTTNRYKAEGIVTLPDSVNNKNNISTTVSLNLFVNKNAVVKVSAANAYYNYGKAVTTKVTVTVDGVVADASTYDLKYSNNKEIGTATVKATGHQNVFNGSGTATFRILSKGVSLILGKMTPSSKAMKISWTKVSDADGYDLFMKKCDGKAYSKAPTKTFKKTKTSVKISAISGVKIKNNKEYRAVVKAYKMVNGKKKYITSSLEMHSVGKKNKKYTNAKSITVSKAKYVLKAGATAKITAKVKKLAAKKKLLKSGAKVRYRSSKPTVVSVDSKGKMKALKKGTAKIYVVALNGLYKTITVTVR